MSVSLLSAPIAFKPTLVSDYFFDEPSSPLLPLGLHDPHASASSPEIESPNGSRGELAQVVGFNKTIGKTGQAEMNEDRDVHMEEETRGFEPIQMPSDSNRNEPLLQQQATKRTDTSILQSNDGSPTHFTLHTNPSPKVVSGHCARVHDNLINSSMVLPPSARPCSVSDRKYSSSSANAAASASSTARNSSSSSPISPCSSMSACQTPSPPPYQSQQRTARSDSVVVGSQQPQRQQQPVAPASTPARYRTVPAAASYLTPVSLPPHTQDLAPAAVPSVVPSPYHQAHTKHAQTPQQTSRHHHNHRPHTGHIYPATPPSHSVQHRHHTRKQSNQENNVEYVGPFILGPVLGRGCTGTVRLGTHKYNAFECAFKIIEKTTLAATSDESAKLWAKVKREIVILKFLENKHVLKLYDVLETENRLYLVLEHVKGGELFDYIVSKGRLDRHESLRIAAQIMMGLEQ